MKKIKIFLKNCGEIIIITLGVGVSLPFVLISVLIDYGKNIGEVVIDTKENISDAIKTKKIEKENMQKEKELVKEITITNEVVDKSLDNPIEEDKEICRVLKK